MQNTVDSSSLIDASLLYPYIVTVSRNTQSANYSKLKAMGVVGVIIESGCLYSELHIEQKYRNPKIDEQVKKSHEAGLPIGFYHTVRARNKIEANKELYELMLVVEKYTPELGVWLDLKLTKSRSINNSIINMYYDKLVALGLKGKIGFYTTKQQLNQIDYKSFSSKWYLWLVDHLNDMSVLDELLTPTLFSVEV